jgi:uncharacterized repeat protein (TIGR03803 family)
MYGETYQGGGVTCTSKHKPALGCGTVYRFNPATGLTVLASFTGPNGAHGNTTMALVGTTLFGATEYGGASDDGVVFSVNTDGSNFQVLHQFSGADGQNPAVVLLPGQNGVVYGTTYYGGSGGGGVLYSITASGSFSILHNFTSATGNAPVSLTIASGGTIFGSTMYGGKSGKNGSFGTVFSYAPATSTYTLLLSFNGTGVTGLASYPYVGSIGPDNTLYAINDSYIFSLSHKSGYVNLAPVYFATTGGEGNSGPIYTPGGTLYGLFGGSSLAYNGILYSLTNGVTTDYYSWSGRRDGANPFAQPTLTATGLIGTASEGGACFYCGTIWQFTP